ncbi:MULTISPECIES: RNA polymerase sigma-70 factor [Butyricimonas]|uniref:RNA polymerase sigma-70 factor n=1 Tax=Butyricimonas TaxID=574697 RepID=UPI001D07E7CC|nr:MULTISPECIES: RNA polymerase sigma-70 factor [Butyricimonas]MCB6972620.1 RNA polymerase sigma-70 factor [Butyricimonas synergistica]MCG4519628.1 RNA polymerase sigma-70 factor [Butyricimonas sp. DFI.6.44]
MQDIVADIRGGNKNSFKEFFEDYYPILCVFASKYVKDDEQCKDIAQEALLSYWEKRKDFEDIYKVKGFLYMVARNRCLNYLKREQVNRAYVNEANLESEEYFHEEVIEQETYRLVQEAVDALPQQMRTIIKYAMEGMKNPRIAVEMGIAEGTVHALKKTAYRKLREQLKEHFYLLLLV